MKVTRKQATHSRHQRVRRKVSGTTAQPRLAVFRSNQHIYAQVIDDVQQHTLVAASSLDQAIKTEGSGATCAASSKVGQLIAERALEQGIKTVVFDRGGNLYHGRVKALADAARSAGLEF